MIKKILAALLALCAAAVFAAAVDANKATQAELEAIKGVGPAIATKILDERKKGSFKDWNDLVERVKGVGEGNAAKFSAEGLTVNGSGFKGMAAAPAVKKDDKPAVKAAAAAPAVAAASATAPVAAKAADKAASSADDKKAAKAAAAEAKKKAKEEKAAAKAAKAADAKASDAKK